jgi:hypothetical protein
MILYYLLMTKRSGLGDSTELSRMGLSHSPRRRPWRLDGGRGAGRRGRARGGLAALNSRAGRAGRGGLASKQRAAVGAGAVPGGQHGQEPARANSDTARGLRDFKAPRVAPGLEVRDLGKARGLGMRPGGPGRRGQAWRGAARPW